MVEKIEFSDILSRWREAPYFEQTPASCQTCQKKFETGQLNYIFGDIDTVAAVKKYRCGSCAADKIAEGENADGLCVFVEWQFCDRKIEDLPPTVRDKILAGLAGMQRAIDLAEEEAPDAGSAP